MTLETEIARTLRDFLQPEGFEIAESDRIFAQRLSPLLNRVRAEAQAFGWEAACHRVLALVDGDGLIDQHRVVHLANPYIEQNSEGSGA